MTNNNSNNSKNKVSVSVVLFFRMHMIGDFTYKYKMLNTFIGKSIFY